MKCKKCGAEINENSKFCSECGTPIDKEESKSSFLSKLLSDKKNIIIIALCLVIVAFAGFMIFKNIGGGVTNYDGTYSNLNEYAPFQVTVKDGVMGVTYQGSSYSGKYEYDDSTNTISSERKGEDDGVKFTLRTVDGNYYLGIDQVDGYYDFGFNDEIQVFKEGTKEREDTEQEISDNKTKEEEKSQKAKEESSKFNGTNLAGDQYVVVGETLDPGIYSFAPVSGEDSFDIDVFDNIDYYNQRENNEGSDYVNHYENYYGDEVVEGIALRDGMVIDVGYNGVQYKKQ